MSEHREIAAAHRHAQLERPAARLARAAQNRGNDPDAAIERDTAIAVATPLRVASLAGRATPTSLGDVLRRADDGARVTFVTGLQRTRGNALVTRLLQRQVPPTRSAGGAVERGERALHETRWFVRPEARRGHSVSVVDDETMFGGSTLRTTTTYVAIAHEWNRETESNGLLRVDRTIRFQLVSGVEGEVQIRGYSRFDDLDAAPADPSTLLDRPAKYAVHDGATVRLRVPVAYTMIKPLEDGNATSLVALLRGDRTFAYDSSPRDRFTGIAALLDEVAVARSEEERLDAAEARVDDLVERIRVLVEWLETPAGEMTPGEALARARRTGIPAPPRETHAVRRYREVPQEWWAQIESELLPEQAYLTDLEHELVLPDNRDRARELARRLQDAVDGAHWTFDLEYSGPTVAGQIATGIIKGTVGMVTGVVEGFVEILKMTSIDLPGLALEWLTHETPLPDYLHQPASAVGKAAEKGATSGDVLEAIALSAPRALDHALTEALDNDNWEPLGALVPEAVALALAKRTGREQQAIKALARRRRRLAGKGAKTRAPAPPTGTSPSLVRDDDWSDVGTALGATAPTPRPNWNLPGEWRQVKPEAFRLIFGSRTLPDINRPGRIRLTLGHIVEKATGGTHSLDNLMPQLNAVNVKLSGIYARKPFRLRLPSGEEQVITSLNGKPIVGSLREAFDSGIFDMDEQRAISNYLTHLVISENPDFERELAALVRQIPNLADLVD